MIDTSFAPNRDDRKSISGILTSMGKTIVSWSSSTQTSIALSSCGAKYTAIALAGK